VQKLRTSPDRGTDQGPAAEPGGSTRVEVIPGRDLDPDLAQAWRSYQHGNPELSSPCFSPEFTQAVAAVRDDVELGLIQQAGNLAAILPFQRRQGSVGTPVGGVVSDYQGLIAPRGFVCDPLDLIKGCRLACWNFDRLLASQPFFEAYHDFCEESAIIDLSRGFETYAAQRRAAGSEQIKKCANLLRRLQRDSGPLRFVVHSPDPRTLAQVLAWKSRQYVESGWRDLFALRWGRALAERIQAAQTETFAGLLSLLYAGDTLIAGHLGMRSATIWHYWFPAFNRDYARYSPGLLLLLKMAQHSPDLGLTTIDLGTGMSLYKQRLMTGSIRVAEGSVEQPAWLRLRRKARRRIKSWLGLGPKALSTGWLAEPWLEISG
jgi:CelD/BcsL family acetyltransferase involved in cellulose biosynthesis